MQISNVSWEENAISIHNERVTGSWTWLQHNYIERKMQIDELCIVAAMKSSIQYGWHGHMGKKTACTSSAESGMHIVHYGVVSWASSSIGGIHTASSFHIMIHCFLDDNHIWSPHNSMCCNATWSFNNSRFCKWVYDVFLSCTETLSKTHGRLVANAAQRPCVDHGRSFFGMNLQSFSSMNIEELLLLLCWGIDHRTKDELEKWVW